MKKATKVKTKIKLDPADLMAIDLSVASFDEVSCLPEWNGLCPANLRRCLDIAGHKLFSRKNPWKQPKPRILAPIRDFDDEDDGLDPFLEKLKKIARRKPRRAIPQPTSVVTDCWRQVPKLVTCKFCGEPNLAWQCEGGRWYLAPARVMSAGDGYECDPSTRHRCGGPRMLAGAH